VQLLCTGQEGVLVLGRSTLSSRSIVSFGSLAIDFYWRLMNDFLAKVPYFLWENFYCRFIRAFYLIVLMVDNKVEEWFYVFSSKNPRLMEAEEATGSLASITGKIANKGDVKIVACTLRK
jgi:hypothetical protein